MSTYTTNETGNKTYLQLLRGEDYLNFSKLYNGSYTYYYDSDDGSVKGLQYYIDEYRKVINNS